jgi:hypothetical protein
MIVILKALLSVVPESIKNPYRNHAATGMKGKQK